MPLGNNVKTLIEKEISKTESLKKALKEREKNYNMDCSKEIANCDATINHYKKSIDIRRRTIMDFGAALKALKEGKRVARKGWNGRGMWLTLQRPDMFSHMTLPYIYIEYPKNPKHHAYPDGSRCPWIASQTDMLSEDWFILEDEVKSEKEKMMNKVTGVVNDNLEDFLNRIFGDEDEGVEIHVIRVHN